MILAPWKNFPGTTLCVSYLLILPVFLIEKRVCPGRQPSMLEINQKSFQMYFCKSGDRDVTLHDTHSNKKKVGHAELAKTGSTFLAFLSKEILAYGDIELLTDVESNCVILNYVHKPYLYIFPICKAVSFETCSGDLLESLKRFAADFKRNQELIADQTGSGEFKTFEDLKKAVFAYTKYGIPFKLFISKDFAFLSVVGQLSVFRLPFLRDMLNKYGIKTDDAKTDGTKEGSVPDGRILVGIDYLLARASMRIYSSIGVEALIKFPTIRTYSIKKTRDSDNFTALQQLRGRKYEDLSGGEDYAEFNRVLQEYFHSSFFHSIMDSVYIAWNCSIDAKKKWGI